MFEQYTERAKRVLAFAKYESSQMGSDTMEVEHLLLGLIREAEDIILRLFNKWNLDAGEIRAEIEMASSYQRRKSAPVEIAISREAQMVLAYAVEESKALEHKYVGTEHIFLGLLRQETGMAARILVSKGVRVDVLREDIVRFHREQAEARMRSRRLDRLLKSEQEAVDALQSLARELSLKDPVYLFSPAEMKNVHDAFEALEAAPVGLAVLAHRSGLVVSSRGLPATLASWIGGLIGEERAALRVGEGDVYFESAGGRAAHLTWVTGQAFLLLVPKEGADPEKVRAAGRTAATTLAPMFESPTGGTPRAPEGGTT